MRRFTLIQGGVPHDVPESAAWRIELRTAQDFEAETVAAWRALLARNTILDPRADPDYVLTAARHLAAGQRVALALAWEPGPAPLLRGVLPLAIDEPLLRSARARPWRPAGLTPRPLLDLDRIRPIHAALAAHLAALPGRILFDPAEPAPAASLFRPRRPIPEANLYGVRSELYRPPSDSVEEIREPARIRDAVETFLALDARAARHPIIAEPQEAAMVRVVTRLFARRQQLVVALASRAGGIVSGTIHLGAGPAAIAWRHAALA